MFIKNIIIKQKPIYSRKINFFYTNFKTNNIQNKFALNTIERKTGTIIKRINSKKYTSKPL